MTVVQEACISATDFCLPTLWLSLRVACICSRKDEVTCFAVTCNSCTRVSCFKRQGSDARVIALLQPERHMPLWLSPASLLLLPVSSFNDS